MIRYLRGLMHVAADAVSGIIADDAVTILLAVLLHCPTNISNASVNPRSLDPEFQTFLGDTDQLL